MAAPNTGTEQTLLDPGVRSPRQRERLFGQKDHLRAYGRDYAERLAEAGFQVKLDDCLRRLGPQAAERHRLGNELQFHLCTERAATSA